MKEREIIKAEIQRRMEDWKSQDELVAYEQLIKFIDAMPDVQPVLTMDMADTIVNGVNDVLKEFCEVPRPIILTIAVAALSTYSGQPVHLDAQRKED